MRILVTGGTGFIGSHVVDHLLAKEHEVTILDTRDPKRDDAEYISCDIIDFEGLKKAFKDIEIIYHLAAVSNVNHVYQKPIRSVDINATGTVKILEAARQMDVSRIIFASTEWVYSGLTTDEIITEEILLKPAEHLYSATKIASEHFCISYWELYQLSFTILRYGIPYGPRARRGTVFPIFVGNALTGQPLSIFGKGDQFRQFIYISDLAEGNVAALNDKAKNQIYNITGKEKISVKMIAEKIQELIENVQIIYKESRPGDYKGVTISIEKAKKDLGWEPKVPFEEGLKKYIEWYKKHEL
ncbi:MAG: NAD-dependent epimerase/dehydratase family protein [Candidatus Helarchaeota archaeon]